ncbi:cytochrome P450 [Amycolatopsis aidingensis]|uniref:cytochrome P450 n=1 Tax=Amycolatopsis aidingensis TaxID=2842453 RepID=UPI001C0CE0FC|nr:cytochrome P450 [Amycolatopsis aidingensis]
MAETTPAAQAARPIPMQRRCPFDPPEELGRLRAERPISRLAYPDGTLGWLVTEYATARRLLADRRFSSRMELMHSPIRTPDPEPTPPGMFIFMDQPEHTRYRKLLTGQFTLRRMRQLEPRIAEFAEGLLDDLERHGPPADLVRHFALPLPSLVICELLGIPEEQREFFQHHTAEMVRPDLTPEQSAEIDKAVFGFLDELVARKRAEPADDILSGLLAEAELSADEAVGMATILLVAGHETTANMLGLGTFALLEHPGQLAALRADPGLMDGAVEELLRYLSIVQYEINRTALEDVELDGQLIKAGEPVTVSLPGANRDPARFDRPDELDVTASAAGHLAFGHGVHQCLGQQLARAEMRIGYTALLRRFPGLRLEVAREDVPLRTDRGIYGVYRLPISW